MFDEDRKPKTKPAVLKRSGPVRQLPGSVLFSCYLASLAIIIIAGLEALKRFHGTVSGSGTFYVVLAVLGLLFSVFITIMNNRNKRLLAEKKKKGKK